MEEKIIGWIKNHMTLVRVFWATIVVGIVCHGHMLFNKLPNCDDVVALTNRGTTFAAGRWLLEYTNILTGKFSIPLFIGLCSIIYIALSGILVSRVLQIKSPLMMLMTGAIMVCFPTVAGTFTFMFTADAYFLALFLAVAAVYLSTLDTANKGVLAIAGGYWYRSFFWR